MRIDLSLQKIQLCGKFFILHFILPGFKFQPVHCKTQHGHKNHDEKISSNDKHDKASGIEVFLGSGQSINEVTFQGQTNYHDDGKGDNKLEQIKPHISSAKKSRKKNEVVEVRGDDSKSCLNRCNRYNSLQVQFTATSRSNLKQEK